MTPVLISIHSMNTQAFKILEFDSLRALVRRHATTEMGKHRIEQIAPIDRFDDLRHALTRAGEMIKARQRGVRLSFDGISDPSAAIARLKIQGTALEPLII